MRKTQKAGFETSYCPPKPQFALDVIPSNNNSRTFSFLKNTKPSYIKQLRQFNRSIDYVYYAKKGLRNITKKYYKDFLMTNDGKTFFLYKKSPNEEYYNVIDYLDFLFPIYIDNINIKNKITNDEIANIKYFLNTPGGINWIFKNIVKLEENIYNNSYYDASYNFYIKKFIDLLTCGNYDEQTKQVIMYNISKPEILKAVLITIPEVLISVNKLYNELGMTDEQFYTIFKYIFKSNKFEKIMNNAELLNHLLLLSSKNITYFFDFIFGKTELPAYTYPFKETLVTRNMCAFFNVYFSRITFPINQQQLQFSVNATQNIRRQKEYINNMIDNLNRILNNCIPKIQSGGKRKKIQS